MYTRSSAFYDICYHFKDYASEAEALLRMIQELIPRASTLLELACGTGKFLTKFQDHFYVEGLDINPEMLDIARSRCRSPVHVARMEDFALGRRFDVIVCLFSSIAYVRTQEALNSTVRCISRHLSPGGIVLIEPWFKPEEYWVSHTKMNVADTDDVKLAWMYRQGIEGNIAILDIHYIVGTPLGVESFGERHELGLFRQEDYQRAFEDAALQLEFRQTGKHGIYIGKLKE